MNFNKILKISAKENVNIDELCNDLREIIDFEFETKKTKFVDIKVKNNENILINKLL